MSAGNPPPSQRTVQPASDTRRKRATGPAVSPARRYPTRHAHDRQMSPPSRKTLLPMVVHPPGEVKASKELCSSPPNAPIRPIVAITQLPDLGLKMPGLPNRASASPSASTQNPAVSVFDRRQDSTRRVAQSMIATRHKNPC